MSFSFDKDCHSRSHKNLFFFTDSSKIEILLEVVRMSMLEHVMLGAAWLLVGQALLDWRSGVH